MGRTVLGAGLATLLAVTSTGNVAAAHTRDSGDTAVVSLPSSLGCVTVRSQLKHNGNDIRIWGKVRSYHGTQGSSGSWSCSSGGKHLKLRLKLQALRRPSGGTYSVCLSTSGDGRGASGYIHSEGTGWEMGRTMTYGGREYFGYPCGSGSYRARTWGYAYNDGWRGSDVDSPAESFPVK